MVHTNNDDYHHIHSIVAYIHEHMDEPLIPEAIARQLGVELKRLETILRDWCGLTPTAFLQTQRLDYARKQLRAGNSVFDTALSVGLSGAGRLHDLFVRYEAMPPGVYRAGGDGITLTLGWHGSPFGPALVAASTYGLAALAFANDGEQQRTERDIISRWPNAKYVFEPELTEKYVDRIFNRVRWLDHDPLTLAPIGSEFDLSVWSKLIDIPMAGFSTYGTIAQRLGRSKSAARAVGAAIGRNPIAFVIPCHRVIGQNGTLTGYHWGLIRKRALIGWEAGHLRYKALCK